MNPLSQVALSSDSESSEFLHCVRKEPRRVSFQLDEHGEVCVQILGENEEENSEEQLIIQKNKVRLTYSSRGQLDPMRLMEAKDQMEQLTKRTKTKGEIREWPPNNQLMHHLDERRRRGVDDGDHCNDDDNNNNNNRKDNFVLEDEIQRAGLVQHDGSYQPWFFGKITRRESEALLESAEVGSFLIRLSENTACCYTLSYRGSGTIRHFLIMVTSSVLSGGDKGSSNNNSHNKSSNNTTPRPEYKLLGSYQSFGTLSSLVHHHGHAPIRKSSHEYLLFPCPRPAMFKVTF